MDPPSSYQHNLSLIENASKSGEDFWLRSRQESREETEEEIEKKYAAYLRKDAYGAMGRGEISMKEKILLGLALFTIVPLKVVLLFATVIPYYLLCILLTLCHSHKSTSRHGVTTKYRWCCQHNGVFDHRDGAGMTHNMSFEKENKENILQNYTDDADANEKYVNLHGFRRWLVATMGRYVSRVVLFILGFYRIKVIFRGGDSITSEEKRVPNEMNLRPLVIVSNHVSYVDILYHMWVSFPGFVAKKSVAHLPIVGLISQLLGCVYVEREDKLVDVKGVSGIILERVQTGQCDKNASPMLLFPEGTTTNGSYLLPFKTGAFLARIPVQPIILKYRYRRLSPAWDTISGVRHVILLLCQFINHLEVEWLPLYIPSEAEKRDAKLYANNVRRFMAKEAGLVLSDIGLHEKRIYHTFLNDMKTSGVGFGQNGVKACKSM